MRIYKYIALIRGLVFVVVLSAPMMVVGESPISSSAVQGNDAQCDQKKVYCTSNKTWAADVQGHTAQCDQQKVYCTSNKTWADDHGSDKRVTNQCSLLTLVKKYSSCDKLSLEMGIDRHGSREDYYTVTCVRSEVNNSSWTCHYITSHGM